MPSLPASWEETTLVTNLCWHGNNENRACKQVRFHSILDGSSLAHAIQVLMGPLLMNYGRMRCTEMKRLLGTELDTQTPAQTDPDAFSDTVSSSFLRLSAMGQSYCVFSESGFFKKTAIP